MTRGWQSLAWIGVALACGAMASLLFGYGPQRVESGPAPEDAWSLPDTDPAGSGRADAVWEQRQPWGAPPAPAAAEAGMPEPVAIPVGTAVVAGKLLAVFLSPDGSVVRLKPGDAISSGGRVDAVTRFHVAWTDARGTKHEQELLADPLPTQVSLP